MRRPGFTGDVWPDDIQELLLRAALLPSPAGPAAWAAVRPRIDIDHLPGELHRLMPLLSRSLSAGGVEETELPRLKGVYQFTWYRNSLLFNDSADVLSGLYRAGIPTMLLRGAAMVAAYYCDTGMRPMNDVDVLVRAGDVERAVRTAQATGWHRVAGSESLERRRGAVWLSRGQGRIVCLHSHPSPNLPDGQEEGLWRRSQQVTFERVATRVPSSADHLVQACADGARANSGSSLRWITDVSRLIRSGDVDWDVVVTEARRFHVPLLLSEALRYLDEALDIPVPTGTAATLAASPLTPRERLAHRLSLTTAPRLPSAAETAGRFIRLTVDMPLRRALATAPAFLEAVLGVERGRDVPGLLARRAVHAVVSPTPPLAALSTAGDTRSRRASVEAALGGSGAESR
jgi:hypothetical protein